MRFNTLKYALINIIFDPSLCCLKLSRFLHHVWIVLIKFLTMSAINL